VNTVLSQSRPCRPLHHTQCILFHSRPPYIRYCKHMHSTNLNRSPGRHQHSMCLYPKDIENTVLSHLFSNRNHGYTLCMLQSQRLVFPDRLDISYTEPRCRRLHTQAHKYMIAGSYSPLWSSCSQDKPYMQTQTCSTRDYMGWFHSTRCLDQLLERGMCSTRA
jgi:hypothetical protein